MTTKAALQELLDVLQKHSDTFNSIHELDIEHSVIIEIQKCNVSEMFDIDLSKCYTYGNGYFKPKWDDYHYICIYGEKYNRTISWSDDGRQPEDEWLYQLSFSTGAYIFGGDYPIETFNDFFGELKSYEPKYVDTANKCLYYTPDKAKAVYEAFDGIYEKYRSLVGEEMKKRRIETLKTELEKLEGN